MINYNKFRTTNTAIKRVLFVIVLVTVSASIGSFFSQSKKKEDKLYHDLFNRSYHIFSIPLPDKMDFCGEAVPLNDFDVRERLDRELVVNVYWQSQTVLFHKRAARWFPVIEPILKRNSVPDDFKYLALIESGFLNAVSPSNAVGFWQFIEETGKRYGLEINEEVDERYHVEKSTEAACKYLKEANEKLGSWTLAAASYNMGITGAKKQADFQGNINYYDLMLNSETSRYVFRILALKEIMKNPRKYGYIIRKKDLYPPIKTYTITVDSTVSNLAAFAVEQGTTYKFLKILNPWLRDKQLTNKTRKTYKITLPGEGFTDYEGMLAAMEQRPDDSLYLIDFEKINSELSIPIQAKIHKVKQGETIESIAKMYNCDTTELRERNKLKKGEQPTVDSEIIVGC